MISCACRSASFTISVCDASIVVADQAHLAALASQSRAGVRLRAVADHVAKAPDLVDPAVLDVGEDRLEGGQVAVDVGEDRDAHGGQGTRVPPASYDGPMSTESIGELREAVEKAARGLRDGEAAGPEPSLDRPPKPELGDYSSNAAMLLAAPLGEKPRDVAERLSDALRRELEPSGSIERVEVAGPGFVNLFLTDAWYRRAVERLSAAERLGPEPTDVARAGPGRVRLRQPDRAAARRRRPARRLRGRAGPAAGGCRARGRSASTTSTTGAARSSASRSRSRRG